MACTCTSTSLIAESTYQVTQGETFQVALTGLTDIQDAKGQLRTALLGGTLIADFGFTIGVDNDEITFWFYTTDLDPGVYYFDLFTIDSNGYKTAQVTRQGLVVVGSLVSW